MKRVKRWLPLVLALTLSACSYQTTVAGIAQRLIPECGPRGCRVSYYVTYLRQQHLIEIGFDSGRPFYRHYAFLNHGNYDLSQLCADAPAAWAQPGSAPC